MYPLNLLYNHYNNMSTVHQKIQIVESLDSLDQVQAAKVLEYIKAMLYTPREEMIHQNFKREAMKEIRKALSSDSGLSVSM